MAVAVVAAAAAVRPSRRPVGPVAVANGKAGAVLLEATGERTKEPTAAGDRDPARTTDPASDHHGRDARHHRRGTRTTAAAPGHGAGPVTTAEVVPPPATTRRNPRPPPRPAATTPARPALPRDGIVVLIGVLLLGVGVALRAIRSRERRIGWALLGFCIIYLLALAGLVTGVAGAATSNPAELRCDGR